MNSIPSCMIQNWYISRFGYAIICVLFVVFNRTIEIRICQFWPPEVRITFLFCSDPLYVCLVVISLAAHLWAVSCLNVFRICNEFSLGNVLSNSLAHQEIHFQTNTTRKACEKSSENKENKPVVRYFLLRSLYHPNQLLQVKCSMVVGRTVRAMDKGGGLLPI
jgi:hypothetical protein